MPETQGDNFDWCLSHDRKYVAWARNRTGLKPFEIRRISVEISLERIALKCARWRAPDNHLALYKTSRKETVGINIAARSQSAASRLTARDATLELIVAVRRWLAHHVVTALSLVELDDVRVSQVLENEEDRRNWHFVSRHVGVDDVSALFANQALQDAVLITTNGNKAEKLLGIATRWDVLHLA